VQRSSSWFSQVMRRELRAGSTVVTLRHNNIPPDRKSKLTKPEKGETDEGQTQEHSHHFLWHPGDGSQRIPYEKPKSQFRIQLWRFMADAVKYAKTSPRTSVTEILALAGQIFWPKATWVYFPHTLLSCLAEMRWSGKSRKRLLIIRE
jgi:hypothetical protein